MASPQKTDLETNVMERLNSAARRIRQLEESIRSVRDHLKSLENDFLKQKEERISFKKDFEKKEEQIKIAVTNLDVELKNINRKLRKTALKRELQELESLVSIFNPLKSTFVTKNEVKKMLDEYMEGGLK